VIFDMRPAAKSVSDGIPIGAHETVNDFGRMGYCGPCPAHGRPHHYRFRLLALDVTRLAMPPHAKCQDVQRAAERHKLAEATLVDTPTRKHTGALPIATLPQDGRFSPAGHSAITCCKGKSWATAPLDCH
jgi:hypothetical protein